MTDKQWFETTLKRFEEDPAAYQGVEGSYQFDYTKDGGSVWHMVFPNDGTYKIGEGTFNNADVSVTCNWSDMLDVVNGKLNPNLAIMKGKIKFKGSMPKAMALAKLLGV